MKMYLWNYKRLPRIITTIIIVLLTLFVFTEEAMAGITGKIAGTVRDAETGERLPMANCILVGTEMGAACDDEGDYFIVNVPPGTYSLEVRMMGYESMTKTGIKVDADHTTPVDFELRSVAVEVPGITVVARREIVKMDLSSSSITSTTEEIEDIPLVTEVADYANMLAGIEGWEVRGGGVSETEFLMDGLFLVDNLRNVPITLPNLSSVKEFSIIKGGFNAEYGNVRSGVVNLFTKKGSFDKYHGSVNFRMTPPHKEHRGPTVFSHDNYYLRPYLDTEDSVCWLGTGVWPDSLQERYPTFEGWNAVSENLLADDDSINDRNPEECRDMFMWIKRAEGANELLEKYGVEDYDGPPREVDYGDKPNWLIDASFGGPVPLINNMSFLASYRRDREMWAIPAHPYGREYYDAEQTQLKLTYKITPDIELSLDGLYKEINSMSNDEQWTWGYGLRSPSAPLDNGRGILFRRGAAGENMSLYDPAGNVPFDRYIRMGGISIDHALSSNTFYSLRMTYLSYRDYAPGSYIYCYGSEKDPLEGRIDEFIPEFERYDLTRDVGMPIRDTTTVIHFGNTPADVCPYGITGRISSYQKEWLFNIGPHGNCVFNFSRLKTVNLRGDLTSQINKYNQIKTGFVINYDDLYNWYGAQSYPIHGGNSRLFWEAQPIRGGAYIQDKIEYGGIIANIGVRVDYTNSRTDQYVLDRYSKYFSEPYKWLLTEEGPKEPAQSHFNINPRFGISHPIGEFTKLFFNYGWFSSMPTSDMLYTIDWGSHNQHPGIQFLGNPSMTMPRTIAYEFGFEHNIANLFLLHVSGYYKDISNEEGFVDYTNYDASVNYTTVDNNYYRDIRGFELRLEKRWGRWITGWINYDYRVTTSGFTGRRHYYEDPREQQRYGMQNPFQEKPLARPVTRANIQIMSPEDWGPSMGGMQLLGGISFNLIYSRRAGAYETWDPLETHELYMNIQWKDWENWDAKLSKTFVIGENQFMLYMDVRNLFDTKHIYGLGFDSDDDYRKYLESLHLSMYEDEKYQEAGYTPGDDKPGDIRSKDKPYINMPNIQFLTFLYPRVFSFGVRVSF